MHSSLWTLIGIYGPVRSSWRQILKEYKMEICAAMVDRTVFSCLLKKLWKASFKAQHLKTGFRMAGLCPLSKDSIPKSSYAPSLPHTSQSQVSTRYKYMTKVIMYMKILTLSMCKFPVVSVLMRDR